MFHLCNVLQFVIDSLNDSPLSQQQLVRHGHHGTPHVTLELRNKLNAVNEESPKQILAYISFVSDKFPIDKFNEGLVFQRLAVINISWRYHEVEQLTLLIAYQMQFETEESSHGAFASLGNTPECLVHPYPLVPAYTQRGAVNEAYSCTLAKQYLFDEQHQRDCNLPFQFYETVV